MPVIIAAGVSACDPTSGGDTGPLVPKVEYTVMRTGVTAPTDDVTIEIVGPHADYANQIHLSQPRGDLGLDNTDIGETHFVETEKGQEIVFEIRPELSGSPVAGPWRTGPAGRNSDGEIHAVVISRADSDCLLVSFEDQDSADWGDHPNEPDYTDTPIWIYPTTRPAYDTSLCPPKTVAEEMVAGR